MENLKETLLESGFIKVRLRVDTLSTDLWRAGDAGGVMAYFDGSGAVFGLPEVCERAVLDGTICARIG